jgi:hypothetical protein
MQHFDIENTYTDVTDQLIPVVNYRIKRQRTLKFLFLAYGFSLIFFFWEFATKYNNIDQETKNMIGDLYVPLLSFNIDKIIWQLVNIGFIFYSIRSEIEDSSKKLLFNFKLQFAVRIANLFFPWYMYSYVSTFVLPSVISINFQVFSQVFFLILSFINSANNYTLTFNKNHLVVPRNIISAIFISLLSCLFALSVLLVVYTGFIFSDDFMIYSKPEFVLVSVIVMFISYIVKILIDNRMTDKNKRMGPYYHGTFFILRFFPAIYLMFKFNMKTNIINLVATNYMTNIIMMDYFINH